MTSKNENHSLVELRSRVKAMRKQKLLEDKLGAETLAYWTDELLKLEHEIDLLFDEVRFKTGVDVRKLWKKQTAA